MFVVFGITGDLAKVMTFRSLYRLERRGLLTCPIVGVAVDDWTDDHLRDHARDVDRGHRRGARRAGVRPASPPGCPTCQGDFADAATYERVGAAIKGAEQPVFYLEIPPFLFGTVVEGLADAGLTDSGPGGRREAVRPRPGVGPGARRRAPPVPRRVADLPDRPLPREDGHRGAALPPVRQHDARAGVEPQQRRVRADHDGRELRRRGPRPLLRPGRRAARRRRQPPHAGGVGHRDGGARRRRPRDAQGRAARRLPGGRDGRPGPLRARPVRRLPRHRRGRRRARPPRPTPPCASTSTTGAGRACRSSSAPASTCRPPRPRSGSSSSARPSSASASPATAGPEPDQLVVKLDPTTGRPAAARRPAGRRAGARADHPRHGVRRGGRRGRDAVRGAAPRGAWSARAPASPARTASRRRGGSCSRCSTRHPPVHPLPARDRGARPPPTSSSPATAAGTPRGSRHEHRLDRPRRAPSRARRCRRRSRRSRTTRSCPTATPARWSPPTARSAGCACPASTPPACSARCSTARPATSGWGRSASTSRRRGPTSRGPTSSPRPGTRRAAGSSSATR